MTKILNEFKNNFAVFILTHGRADNVKTYGTLRRLGYTGKIYLIIDNEDKQQEKYIQNYKDEVIVFDKNAVSETIDEGDNFQDRRAIVYARNAAFEIARKLNLKYFMQLDDDYPVFCWRFDKELNYVAHVARNLDEIFLPIFKYFYNTSAISTIALAQGGDYIGMRIDSQDVKDLKIKLKRKCMNSFICSTERPIRFSGRANEDVNTYTRCASTGLLMFTVTQVSLTQMQSTTNTGGMSELYNENGLYVKAFYSVMYHPSSVKVKILNSRHSRIHHCVNWNNTVPKILHESLRKN